MVTHFSDLQVTGRYSRVSHGTSRDVRRINISQKHGEARLDVKQKEVLDIRCHVS